MGNIELSLEDRQFIKSEIAKLKTDIIGFQARIAFLEAMITPPRKEPKKRKRGPTDYTEQIMAHLYKDKPTPPAKPKKKR